MKTALRHLRPSLLALASLGVLIVLLTWNPDAGWSSLAPALGAQESAQPREVRIRAHRYAYSPSKIEVQEGDLIKVTMESEDIPHSFTIDDPYRIAKRATPGHPVVFEFRADQAGTFPFYCNLTAEDGCRDMRGELVVRPRR